jgi:hypothetical protein
LRMFRPLDHALFPQHRRSSLRGLRVVDDMGLKCNSQLAEGPIG